MFNPRFMGILKHPGYNGFDPLSATAATAILAETAAPVVASEAIIPSILTGIGGIGAADVAAITAAEAGALAPIVGGSLTGGSAIPSILSGIGGIGAGDTAALASALGGAAPGTVGSTLESAGLADLASITPGSLDPVTGQLVDATTANATNTGINLNAMPATTDATTGMPQSSFDFAAGQPSQGVNLGTGMPGGTPGAPGVTVPQDTIGSSVLDQVPGNPATDITSPSFGKFAQGAKDAQGILGKMGLGGLEEFYNKNKLLSNVAMSAGMGMLGSNKPGVAPIKKYDGRLSKYHLAAPGVYQPVTATPNVYQPSYASGGIVGFDSGGKTSSGNVPRWGGVTGTSSSTNPLASYFPDFTYNPGGYFTNAQGQTFMPSYTGNSPSIGNYGGYNMRNENSRNGWTLIPIHGEGRDHGKTTTATTTAPATTSTPPAPNTQIYKPAQAPTQTQTNIPQVANADLGMWDESMYMPMFAEGGIASYGLGGEINPNYPQAREEHTQFANENQLPTTARNMQYGPKTDPMTGQMIGFAEGGVTDNNMLDLADPGHKNPLMEYYALHSKAKEALPHADVGIYHDTDPDTRNLDALQAAQVRLRKQFSHAQMKQPKTNLKEMPALGSLPGAQHQIQEAASGGIMGYSLGGYASGGNPRLLKGPGDGMSDNIPATIADRQPARLADGEFVVPADVVSHLGNGSTDAGAKKLHHMMDKVRVARTGKKAQGKQINPNKFLPA